MASPPGDLGPAAIGVVFLVVLSTMFVGVHAARGDLLPGDRPSAQTVALREAVWTAINRRRAAWGLRPITRNERVGPLPPAVTAASLVPGVENASDAASGPGAGTSLDEGGFCHRLVVSVPRRGADLGDRIAARLAAEDAQGLLRWRHVYKVELGLEVGGDAVYASYRTCRRHRTSP